MGPLGSDGTMLDAFPCDDLPGDLFAQAKVELAPGEKLLWAGRPGRGPEARASWLPWVVWLVGLWLLGSVAAFVAKEAEGRDTIHKVISHVLMGVACVACFSYPVALVMTIRERSSSRRRRSRTVYALSDRRAICWLPSPTSRGIKVVSIPGRSIDAVYRVERHDGSGSIRFVGDGLDQEFGGFEGVADVRRVERLAREILVDPDYQKDGSPAPNA